MLHSNGMEVGGNSRIEPLLFVCLKGSQVVEKR